MPWIVHIVIAIERLSARGDLGGWEGGVPMDVKILRQKLG